LNGKSVLDRKKKSKYSKQESWSEIIASIKRLD
jgi:hypothetical protein